MSSTEITAEPGMPQIVVTREFDAPRELLFRAHTDPELLAQWLGPRRLAMTVQQLEPRDGGRWRFTHHDTDGADYVFHGVFHGTPSVDGIVQTWEYTGAPGHVQLETATFEDLGAGRTRLRVNSVFQSVADRDAHVAAGMEHGVRDGMERLTELLTGLVPVA
jgi:uncharacterized protein YndB with AHSA1/START domain